MRMCLSERRTAKVISSIMRRYGSLVTSRFPHIQLELVIDRVVTFVAARWCSAESHGFSFAVLLSVLIPTSERSRIYVLSHEKGATGNRTETITRYLLNVP